MKVHSPIMHEDIKRSYKFWALHYDYTFAPLARYYIKRTIKLVNREIRGRVLDVGTGTGLSLPYFADHLSISAIDLSNDMLQHARKRAARLQLKNIDTLEVMDAENLEFPDNHFDAVIATFVMSVVPDPLKVMQEIYRVCARGGYIYIINHFADDENTVYRPLEKLIAPISRKIGFHSDLALTALQIENISSLQTIEKSYLAPFKLFMSLKLRKYATTTTNQ